MVTSMLMLLKENKTNKNKAVTTPQSLFAAYVVLLLFNLLSHTYKTQSAMHQSRQKKCTKDSKMLLFLLGITFL